MSAFGRASVLFQSFRVGSRTGFAFRSEAEATRRRDERACHRTGRIDRPLRKKKISAGGWATHASSLQCLPSCRTSLLTRISLCNTLNTTRAPRSNNCAPALVSIVMRERIWRVGERFFDLSRHGLIMGVLNVTPDSFSDGGEFFTSRKAIERGLAMAAEGADIIDVGGESTRPGSEPVAGDEELRRVIAVVENLRAKIDVPISIDTSKAEVARTAIEAGASIV